MLEVHNLTTCFVQNKQKITAIEDVSFSLKPGKTLCMIGESGCGKTVSLLSLMGLSGGVSTGRVMLEGQDLLCLKERSLRQLRGNRISLIFQEPQAALNPVITIGRTLSQLILAHKTLPRAQVKALAVELMERVGLPTPHILFSRYPHELSGGMRQRVLIAGALCHTPAVVLADEPTSALDVTIRGQIIELFASLQKDQGCSFLIASHDLSLVRRLADQILVMYAGQVVEYGDAATILRSPKHPYTKALLAAGRDDQQAEPLLGDPPSPAAFPQGCRFHPRCPVCNAECAHRAPTMLQTSDGVQVQCHLP